MTQAPVFCGLCSLIYIQLRSKPGRSRPLENPKAIKFYFKQMLPNIVIASAARLSSVPANATWIALLKTPIDI